LKGARRGSDKTCNCRLLRNQAKQDLSSPPRSVYDFSIRMDPVKFRVAIPAADPPDTTHDP
jgi:hypothetical protein